MSRLEKCLKMPLNLTSQVHALLGGFLQGVILSNYDLASRISSFFCKGVMVVCKILLNTTFPVFDT